MGEPKRLVDIAAQKVFDNFRQYNPKTLGKILMPLEQPRRAIFELFLKAIDSREYENRSDFIERFWLALPYLMKGKSYTEFDMEDLAPRKSYIRNYQFQEIVTSLYKNSPNLRRVLLKQPMKNVRLSLGSREVHSITKLTQLKYIKITGVLMDISGFYEIVRSCKKLETFHADKIEFDEEELPNSLIIRGFNHQRITAHNIQLNLFGLDLKKEKSRRFPHRHIQLDIDLHDIADLRRFEKLAQKITHVTVFMSSNPCKHEDKMDQFLHFPLVKHAEFHSKPWSANAFKCFLRQNGKTIEILEVFDLGSERVKVEELFRWCPNLYSLKMFDSSLYGDNVLLEMPTKLRSVFWIETSSEKDSVPLTTILSAPLLEKVFISADNLNYSNSDAILDRISRRKILQNLKSFSANPFGGRRLVQMMQDEPKFHTLITAVTSCINT